MYLCFDKISDVDPVSFSHRYGSWIKPHKKKQILIWIQLESDLKSQHFTELLKTKFEIIELDNSLKSKCLT